MPKQMEESIQKWIKLNLWKTVCKKFEAIWSAKANFLKDAFHKFYLVHF